MEPFNNNSGGNHSESKFESNSEDPELDSDFVDITMEHNNGEDADGTLWEINLQPVELLSNADTTPAWQQTPWNNILINGEGEYIMSWWEINSQSSEEPLNNAGTTSAWQQTPCNNTLINGDEEDGMPWEINFQSEQLPNNAETMSAWQQTPSSNTLINEVEEDGMPPDTNLQLEGLQNDAGTLLSALQQTPWNNTLIDGEDEDVMQWEITIRRSEEIPNNADTMSAWQQAPSNNSLFTFEISPSNAFETQEWEWQSDEDYYDIEIPPREILPAAKFVVEGLPEVEMRGGTEAVCAVCSEEIAKGEKVKMLPCWHYYHGECIVPWLKMRTTCPICRFELPTDDEIEGYLSKRRRISEATINNEGNNGSLKDLPVSDSFELSLVLDYEDCKQY